MAGADSTSAALEHIMSRFGRLVRSVGRKRGLADDELDELAQEVRIRLWRSLAGAEKIGRAPASYVYRAAMSAALDMIRRARSRPEEPFDTELGGDRAIDPGRSDAAVLRRELAERIDRAIRELAEPRDVVVRLHLSGYDRAEIARLLGWTEPKVRNLLYRGLADLRALLSHEGIRPERVM